MGAANVSLSKDNEYSKDAQEIATAWAILCGAGLVFDSDFRQEVGIVADKLMQADVHAKDLKSQINSIQSKIDVEKSASANEKAEFDRLASEIQSLQTQLSQLTSNK